MRALLIVAVTLIPALAQSPAVRLVNPSRPASREFQVGDRFEIWITGAPNQPVSVRTTRQGRTDWGPVIGMTDSNGRWSTAGQFEKRDFGGWTEVWTIGGKRATPAIQFSVAAPCLPGGQAGATVSGPNTIMNCETTEGRQTFVTPSLTDPFRTPDGRLVPGRPESMTPEQYHSEILEFLIVSREANGEAAPINLQSSRGGLGDEAGDLIRKLVGVNALSENETRNVLSIVRAVFSRPETIPQSARIPSQTLLLLRHLAESTDREDLKQQIAGTIAYLAAMPAP
jgi:hypothetical protein